MVRGHNLFGTEAQVLISVNVLKLCQVAKAGGFRADCPPLPQIPRTQLQKPSNGWSMEALDLRENPPSKQCIFWVIENTQNLLCVYMCQVAAAGAPSSLGRSSVQH